MKECLVRTKSCNKLADIKKQHSLVRSFFTQKSDAPFCDAGNVGDPLTAARNRGPTMRKTNNFRFMYS